MFGATFNLLTFLLFFYVTNHMEVLLVTQINLLETLLVNGNLMVIIRHHSIAIERAWTLDKIKNQHYFAT